MSIATSSAREVVALAQRDPRVLAGDVERHPVDVAGTSGEHRQHVVARLVAGAPSVVVGDRVGVDDLEGVDREDADARDEGAALLDRRAGPATERDGDLARGDGVERAGAEQHQPVRRSTATQWQAAAATTNEWNTSWKPNTAGHGFGRFLAYTIAPTL